MNDIRWRQRFENYKKALKRLREACEISSKRELSDLEKQGLIQAFEFTHELAWKTMKNFLEYHGIAGQIFGSRDAVREAFNAGLIDSGEDWMNMIKSRNLTSHIYDEEIIDEIVDMILNVYIFRFEEFEKKLENIEDKK